MARRIDGAADLQRKFKALTDPTSNAGLLRLAIREPLNIARDKATQSIRVVSPGKTLRHRTYRGRLVWRGFASRNITTLVVVRQDKVSAFGLLGVKSEAFYAINFFELGTSKIPRRPWLVPAFSDSKDPMIAAMGNIWRERIERLTRRRGA